MADESMSTPPPTPLHWIRVASGPIPLPIEDALANTNHQAVPAWLQLEEYLDSVIAHEEREMLTQLQKSLRLDPIDPVRNDGDRAILRRSVQEWFLWEYACRTSIRTRRQGRAGVHRASRGAATLRTMARHMVRDRGLASFGFKLATPTTPARNTARVSRGAQEVLREEGLLGTLPAAIKSIWEAFQRRDWVRLSAMLHELRPYLHDMPATLDEVIERLKDPDHMLWFDIKCAVAHLVGQESAASVWERVKV